MLPKHNFHVHNEVKQPEEIETQKEDKQSLFASKWEKIGKEVNYEKYVIANSDGTFKCTVCNKVGSQSKNFPRHFQTLHEKLKPFLCAVCKRSFGAKQLLMRHNELHHEQVSKKKLQFMFNNLSG